MQKTLIPTGRSKGFDPSLRNATILPVMPDSYTLLNNNLVVYTDNKLTYLKEGFLTNSTVYAIISQISKKFASIPLIVYEVKPDQKKAFERYKCMRKDFNPASLTTMEVLKRKSMDEVEGTPINALLDNPAPNLSRADLLEQVMGFRLIAGAGAMRCIMSERTNQPLELEVLPTPYLYIVGDGSLNGIKSFKLQLQGAAMPTVFNAADIMYWKYWNPAYDLAGSHLYGLSPIRAGLKDIQTNNVGKTAAAAMLHNGGVRGILTPAARSGDAMPDFTEEQAIKLRDLLDERMNGAENKGKVVSAQIPLTWQEMGMSAVDMSLIEVNKLSKVDICNLFNFPPVLLTNDAATYNNIVEAKKDLVSNIIVNECTSFTDTINRWLVPKFNIKNKTYHVDFDISALPEMQDDMKAMAEALEKMPYLTPNEKRSVQKWDESKEPDMDKFYFPSTVVPLDQLNADMGQGIDPALQQLGKAGISDY